MQIKKVYGPYKNRQNRRHVIIYFTDGSKITKSYARYLYEREYGPVPDGFEVDHIDNDKTNDVLSNFQLLPISENRRKSVIPALKYLGTCGICGSSFERTMRQVRANWNKGKSGPFCSRSCAGKHNARVVQR
jgi:hypothetical protein